MRLEKYIGKSYADTWIWVIFTLLALGSILIIYSSTSSLAYIQKAGNTEYYLLRQAILLMVGVGILYASHLINYKYYGKFALPALLFVCIPLLLYTICFADPINEARRWIQLPVVGFTIQSSDIAKLGLIVYVAYALSKKRRQQLGLKDFLKAFGLPILVICGLIAPADLSTAVLLFTTCLALMFIGAVPLKELGKYVGLCSLAFIVYLVASDLSGASNRLPTWKNRIMAYTSAEVGHQEKQAKIAIATGGLTGKGPGKSVQKNFLPHPYSDFIFAILIEEYGLIAGLGVLVLYILLLWRALLIFRKSPGAFGAFLAFGLMMMLVFQALVNMMVTVGIFPVTGIPLPFVSMGGTSLFFSCAALGIVLSVSRYIEINSKPKKQKQKKKKYALG